MLKNTMFFNDFGEDGIARFLRIQKKLGFPKQNRGFLVWDVCIRCPSKCAFIFEPECLEHVFVLVFPGPQKNFD